MRRSSGAVLPPPLDAVRRQIDGAMLRDRGALDRRLRELGELARQGKAHEPLLAAVSARLVASRALVERRRSLLPREIGYPDDLPVAAHREEILRAIDSHQVVILAGDTGSGKTTQLPKFCLELGRGVRGMIGHTQPRRIAAQAVAARIADELGVAAGHIVGYQVRFTDRSSDDTLVKLMTDGILLAEIQRDHRLERYDTIIIDEAHERSLNVDFLIGYLKRVLAQRRELKLIVTSATIDVERFSRHFGGAPVIEVSGRTWPVEVWYRPPPEKEADLAQAVVTAIEEIIDHERGTASAGSGDILVFHAGERDIRESALAIRKAALAHTEVLPLYSRLGQAEQARVLSPGRRTGRRIVLATNVAETSLTVPGVRYVIDPGFARTSRYSVRSKVQRLPIEAVSRASADQRKGRCGRLGPGICIRLYSEEDFTARPAYTEPEILRTGLASVILQMNLLGLGDIARFPFLDQPDARQINDGVRLLEELGALRGRRLTPLGRKLARLPVDPRIARMLTAAAGLDASTELLVIASFLSVQDPRERPADRQQAADESHRRFACESSDFVAMLNLWRYVEERRQELSTNQFRRLCQKEFLSFMRLREWRDIHHQLRLICLELGMREQPAPASEENIHRAVLAGMLTHIGTRTEERDYEGVRGRRFSIHPGSFLFRRQPKWVVSAELVETTRLYARGVAAIDPEWVFPWAEHLVKREHYAPRWHARRGKVLASERVRLFGLLVADGKRIDYVRVDPAAAREIFIQSALVEGDYRSTRHFWTHNEALRAELALLEAKGRRRDLLVEDRAIFDFYDARLPASVCDHPSLEKWLGREQQRNPDVLCMQREMLLRRLGSGVSEAQFPDVLEWRDLRIPLSYCYEPGNPADGVTAVVPLAVLERLPIHLLDWLVPGLLREKLIALIKALPKQHRKPLVPVPDTVDRLIGLLERADRPLVESLAEAIRSECGVLVPAQAWQPAALDPFYRMNVRLVDASGDVVAESRDLDDLRRRFAGRARHELQDAAPERFGAEGITSWDFGTLPDTLSLAETGMELPGYPALSDRGDSVAIVVGPDRDEALEQHRAGVRRLVLLVNRQGVGYFRRKLLREARTLLRLGARFRREDLVEDMLLAAVDACLPLNEDLPREKETFSALASRCMSTLGEEALKLEHLLARIGEPLAAIRSASDILAEPIYQESRRDIEAQLDALLAPGFLHAAPRQWLERYPVYLQAIALRLQKLPQRLARDLEAVWELQELTARWQACRDAPGTARQRRRLGEHRWLLEEYRISLFAQQLGTAVPVSRKRIDRHWSEVLQPD
jgi:ATP-dependent helicase HrpA